MHALACQKAGVNLSVYPKIWAPPSSISISYMNYATPTRTSQVPTNFHHQTNGHLTNEISLIEIHANGYAKLPSGPQ